VSDETAERLLEAGRSAFAAHGYDGATTRGICAAAGVNVATLAYHFGGKEGLYRAVVDRMYESMLAVAVPDPLPGDLEARIRCVVGVLWRFAREHRTDIRLLLRHVLEHERLPEEVNRRWTPKTVAAGLALVQALGLPPDRDPRLALLTLNHLMARYAVTDPAELGQLLGADDPDAAIEAHLAEVAALLLSR
jgi:AcrR family transcriptional regulator